KEKKTLHGGKGSWSLLEQAAFDLDASVGVLLDFLQREPFPATEVLWKGKLEGAQQDLLSAIQGEEAQKLNDAVLRITQVIGQVPTRLNERLINAANELPLSKLAQKLGVIGANLARLNLDGEAAKRLEEFNQGLASLQQLDRALRSFVDNHNCLQHIDNELR